MEHSRLVPQSKLTVVCYVLYLGFKHRGFTLFTAANPAMPCGGFIGESKAEILQRLGGEDGEVARYDLISVDKTPREAAQGVDAFMRRHGLRFPVVLKPDAGQRGLGVVIVHTEEEVTTYFEERKTPTIVQEYAAGKEFGVFYYRRPGARLRRIFAITDKILPVVAGDGSSTLEELILSDDRAVCMAGRYLRAHARRLHEVPAAGEQIQLATLGTHCLGAVFRDGAWARTPQLEAAFDRISKRYEGFYFGRYDVRTPSVKDFCNGKSFKIIELNGVTSEATNIYDPDNGLADAYRILMQQWRLAFEIGSANRARGAKAATARALLKAGYSFWASTRRRF